MNFHGGYRRISHASGNSWSNALDVAEIPLGPFAAFWGDFISSAVDGQHDAVIGGDGMSQIFNIWSGLAQGEGFGIAYGDNGEVGVVTHHYIANNGNSTGTDYVQVNNAQNFPIGFKQFINLIMSEASTQKDAAGVASVLINRMRAMNTDLKDPNWVNKIGTKSQYDGFNNGQYKEAEKMSLLQIQNSPEFRFM